MSRASSRTVIIAGAGIGGLTAALAIARHGFAVTVFDQAQRLEEIGAGIQLSPNASRILIALGLGEQLRRHVVAPEELRVMNARTARVLARVPIDAVRVHPGIVLNLGARVEDFVLNEDGVTVFARSAQHLLEDRGVALIGADGLWSGLRQRLGHRREPRFARRTAWRALAPADALIPELRAPAVNLWFGTRAHLVHYPVRGGSLVNVVAIVRDDWREPGWSAPGERAEILARYRAPMWSAVPRALLAAPEHWQKWALYDRPPLARWGKGAVTLLGDAAHPMLPYLAQGAAMAIEDAAVLAQRLADTRDDPAGAMRRYERQRRRRAARAQRAARRNGIVYQLGVPGAFLRTLALTAIGGERLLARYDWLYGWRPA